MPGSAASLTGRPTCKNPATEDVYYFYSNAGVYKWTQASNTWGQVNFAPPNESMEAAVAYDTTRDRILLLRGSTDTGSLGGAYCSTYDTVANTFTARTLTGASASTLTGSTKGFGMVYVPLLDSYVVRLGATGGAIYLINADTFAVTAPTTTGGSGIPVTGSVSGTSQNVYGKFLYFPLLGGVVYIPSYAANAWFLRLH
jgi:hypothetical protein